QRAGAILARAYRGRVSASYPSFSDAPLARVHYIIGFSPRDHEWPDLKAVEAQVTEAARTWEDRFEDAVRASGREPDAVTATLARYGEAFPAGYRDRFAPAQPLADPAGIATMPRD